MGILSIILNNIDLDNHCDEDDLDTVIIWLLAWHSKFKKCKAPIKKSEKLLSTAFNVSVVSNLEVPRHFATQRLDLVQTSF